MILLGEADQATETKIILDYSKHIRINYCSCYSAEWHDRPSFLLYSIGLLQKQ